MSTTVQAAPIVYARTAFLDFRSQFLARPGWFTPDDVTWAQGFVSGACVYADKLRDGKRWVLFGDDHIRVFGVVAMATELSETMTHEIRENGTRGRELFAFVGLAVRRPPAAAGFDFIPPRDTDMALYRRIYDDVMRDRWLEKRSGAWEQASLTFERPVDVKPAVPVSHPIFRLVEGQISIHPQSQDAQLWDQAASAREPVNLVLGMPGAGHVKRQNFDVVSTTTATQQTYEPRYAELVPARAPPQAPGLKKKTPEDRESIEQRLRLLTIALILSWGLVVIMGITLLILWIIWPSTPSSPPRRSRIRVPRPEQNQ